MLVGNERKLFILVRLQAVSVLTHSKKKKGKRFILTGVLRLEQCCPERRRVDNEDVVLSHDDGDSLVI